MREIIRVVRGGIYTEIPTLMREVGCLMGATANMMSGDTGGYAAFNSDKTLDEIMSELSGHVDEGFQAATKDYLLRLIMDMIAKVFDWIRGE